MLSTAVLFVGREYNGSKRWLALGPLSFQPSEYAKLAVVVLLAAIVSRNASHMKSWKYMFLVILLIPSGCGAGRIQQLELQQLLFLESQ